MRVLLYNAGADTGGVLSFIAKAFRNEPGWEVHSLASSVNYINYPVDLEWSPETFREQWNAADLVHLHHNFLSAERARIKYGIRHKRQYVVEFHGTGFRENPAGHLGQMRRYRGTGLVSTLDLWLLAPTKTEWLPCPMNIEELQMRRTARDGDTIRIASAPTNREIKSTEALIAAVRRLQDEGHNVELDLIENQTWDSCLERKSKADIYFDQVILGYGNNAIEAWGMGIPVVCGAQPATLAEMERRFGTLPFYRATEDTIYDALKELVQSPDLRAEYSEKGLAHVRRFHAEEVVVEQLKDVYTRALEGRR